MEWQFRKAVQSFQNYKRSSSFKHEIEKGEQSTLDMVIRQTELILSDPTEKIISKVLALRFIRDLMVLGQEDILKRVEKLIPQLTKICSHELGSTDPDRGETYFHSHPLYLKAAQQDKKQIETYGSTYFILSLQSILHWAIWMPMDSNGQPTIYAKAYQTLIDRGVAFPTTFHYYKQSDTEKFRNVYKMEFFTDSYESAYSQSHSHLPSQLTQLEEPKSRSGWDKNKKHKNQSQVFKENSQQYSGEAIGIKTVSQIVKVLTELKLNKSRKMGLLKELHKSVQQMHQINGSGKAKSDEKRWLNAYIINFSLLNSNLIDYEQFLQRCLTEEVVIQEGLQEEQINVSYQGRPSPMKPFVKAAEDSKAATQRVPQDISKLQEIQFRNKLNSYGLQIQQKVNELAIQRSNFQKEKNQIIDNYQARLQAAKAEVRKTQQEKGPFQKELQAENQRLTHKVAALEQELINFGSNTSREKDIEAERNQLLTKVKRLEIQNEKLQHMKNAGKNSEKQLAALQTRVKQKEAIVQKIKGELKKWEKMSQNYQDQAVLYKSELINQRGKHQQKLNAVKKSADALTQQNNLLRQSNFELKKTLDLKDIENLHLKEELKRFQHKLKEVTTKSYDSIDNRTQQLLKAKSGFQNPEPRLQSPLASRQVISPYSKQVASPKVSNTEQLKYKQYQDLFWQLRPNNKQLFLRLCRCGMKKKDILFKENQLQIGIITQVLGQNKLRFILHFTNTSEKQIQNIKIDSNLGDSCSSSLDYSIENKYIFCIQPQDQEKLILVVTNSESPFLKERAILQLSYEKAGSSYFHHLFLPFLIPKFCDFYKPRHPSPQLHAPKESLSFRYNKKMLPKSVSFKGYFDQAVEVEPGIFQMEAYHRQCGLSVKLVVAMGQNENLRVDVACHTQNLNDKQFYVFEQLLSFIEIAFKK